MDSKEMNRMLDELVAKNVSIETIEKISGMVSSSNSWESVQEYLEKEGSKPKEYFEVVSGKLCSEGCFGYATHVIVFMDELIDKINSNEEEQTIRQNLKKENI